MRQLNMHQESPKHTVVTIMINKAPNSKKPSMANIDFRGEVSSSDLGMDWTWLLEPLPPMLQESHLPLLYIMEEGP